MKRFLLRYGWYSGAVFRSENKRDGNGNQNWKWYPVQRDMDTCAETCRARSKQYFVVIDMDTYGGVMTDAKRCRPDRWISKTNRPVYVNSDAPVGRCVIQLPAIVVYDPGASIGKKPLWWRWWKVPRQASIVHARGHAVNMEENHRDPRIVEEWLTKVLRFRVWKSKGR